MLKKSILLILSFLLSISFSQSLITDIEKDSLGTIIKIKYYRDNKNGIELIREKSFFDNGKIKNEIHYSNGLLHGKWILYYENGNKKLEKQFYQGAQRSINRYNLDGNLSKIYQPLLGIWDTYEFSWYHHDIETGLDSLLFHANLFEEPTVSEYIEYNVDEYIYSFSSLQESMADTSLYSIFDNEIWIENHICDSNQEPYKAQFSVVGDTLKINRNFLQCPGYDDYYNKVTAVCVRRR